MDDADLAVDQEIPRRSFPSWPTRVLGPRPGLKELNVAAWAWLAAMLVQQFCVPLFLRIKAGAGLTHIFPSDFVYFYGIGRSEEHTSERQSLRHLVCRLLLD